MAAVVSLTRVVRCLVQAWGEFKTFLEDGRKQLGANFVVQVR